MHAQRKRLGEDVERLGRMAERAVASSVEAMLQRDVDLAKQVVAGDAKIDDAEVELEKHCLKILRQDRVHRDDFRLVISVLKMNKDVERVGDLAKHIAHLALRASSDGTGSVPVERFEDLASAVQSKLEDSLDAVRDRDVGLARRILAEDRRAVPLFVQRQGERDGESVCLAEPGLDKVAKHLKRVGDLANNVAKTLVDMVEGQGPRPARRSAVAEV